MMDFSHKNVLVVGGVSLAFMPLWAFLIAAEVKGVLWAAFTIFVFFAIIFTCVCVIVAKDYLHRQFKDKLTKAERTRFINMKQHIESGRHFYDKGEYCTVCGHKKTGRQPAKKK